MHEFIFNTVKGQIQIEADNYDEARILLVIRLMELGVVDDNVTTKRYA